MRRAHRPRRAGTAGSALGLAICMVVTAACTTTITGTPVTAAGGPADVSAPAHGSAPARTGATVTHEATPSSPGGPSSTGSATASATAPVELDVCTLVSQRDIDSALADLVSDASVATVQDRRITRVPVPGGSVLEDICGLVSTPAVDLSVMVIPQITQDAFADLSRGHGAAARPVDGLGDAALVTVTDFLAGVAVRVGHVAMHVSLVVSTSGDRGRKRAAALTIARAALEHLPDRVDLPGLTATAPCSELSPVAVAAAAGSAPIHSRSFEDGGRLVCSFAGTAGDVTLTLVRGRASTVKADAHAGAGAAPVTVQVGEKSAYWRADLGLLMAVGKDELVVDAFGDAHRERPSSGEIALAKNAATVLTSGH